MPNPITVTGEHGDYFQIEGHPNQCPVCHAKISPNFKLGRIGNFGYGAQAEVVYACPNTMCNESFIAYFEKQPNSAVLCMSGARPIEPAPLTFEESVKQISSSFCAIHEQAHKAEQLGLTQICGVGYRKSLEFLIKDYLINRDPADEVTIKAITLGPCIGKYVTDPRIKDVANRATWLGNDETHYQRKWIDKELTDLKILIKLVIHWIDAEYLTEEARRSMPAPGKP